MAKPPSPPLFFPGKLQGPLFLKAPTDIKPSNILVETLAINEMFQKAPSEAFHSDIPPLAPPNDFYMESVQVSSAEEDLTRTSDLSVRLADFGTGKLLT